MTASQRNSFNLPPAVVALVDPDPLEALRSPQLRQNSEKTERESITVSEFNDIALDDESFSPVALTAQPGVALEAETNTSFSSGATFQSSRPRSISTTTTTVNGADFPPAKFHRKTASTTTIRSAHEPPAVSLLINRLGVQEPGPGSRGSVDGHFKLQEEFARLHERESKDSDAAEKAIDWGQYLNYVEVHRTLICVLPRFLGRSYIW